MQDEDKHRHYQRAQQLISEQNFAAAVVAGAVATLLSALVYGATVERWPFSFGFAAAGVGTVVGFIMGILGRGISTKFSVLAATFTVAGCILGNLFVGVWNRASPTSSFIDVLQNTAFSDLARWSVAGLSPIYLVFWFVAVGAAMFLAKRPLSRSDRLAIGLYKARA
jgi:dipeptide/tripeptide permease